jgi:cytochrome c oxidase assembly factor CtaG
MDALAARRLWVHMAQHVVLVSVSAPLLVLGARWPRLTRAWPRGPGSTAAALAVHVAAVWAWHAPGPYQAALRTPVLHAVEHASFLVTGALFWWAVIGARRQAAYGVGVLLVFAAALQGTALGAWMTLAQSPWYRAYPSLDDQLLAGVVMWCAGGFAYAVAAAALFHAWLSVPST